MGLALSPRLAGNRIQGPYGLAGVDPSHLATRGLLFSGIPANSGFVNFRTGKVGTKAGTPTESILAVLGRASGFLGGGNTDAYRFSGQDATNYGSNTIAAICSFNTISTTQLIFSNNTSDAGIALNVAGNGTLQVTMFGVVAVNSSIVLSANVPYFIVVSKNGTTGIDFLAMRLDTQTIETSTASSGTPVAGNGTYAVGNGWAGGAWSMDGNVAAVMLSSSYLHPSELRKWAADPWAFWYPRRRTV